MPIELKELVIRTSISNQNQSAANHTAGDEVKQQAMQEAIVSACVKEVLKQLKQQEQR